MCGLKHYNQTTLFCAVTQFKPRISHATPCWLQNHANIIFTPHFQTKTFFLTIGHDFLCTFIKDYEEKKFLRGSTFRQQKCGKHAKLAFLESPISQRKLGAFLLLLFAIPFVFFLIIWLLTNSVANIIRNYQDFFLNGRGGNGRYHPNARIKTDDFGTLDICLHFLF